MTTLKNDTNAQRPIPDSQDRSFTWSHLHIWRPIVVGFFRLLFLLLGPVKSRGAYRVPRKGGVLILSNHLADCDPPVVQIACPRAVRFMAKSDLWDIKWLGGFMSWAGAFPVKRGEPDRGALKHAADLLKQGEAVCVFPEGQLSEDGGLHELKPGIALIVRLAGVPVICCGIRGSNNVMPYGTLVPRPSWRSVHVNWGEPKTFGPKATTEEIMAWVEGSLRELVVDC